MDLTLGQSVLDCKANVSYDSENFLGQPVLMRDGTKKRAWNRALIARTQYARKSSGLSQEEMAAALDMPQDHYKHYEIRTPMPGHLWKKFMINARVTEDWFVRAKGAEHLKEPIRRQRRKRKDTAA